MKKQILHLINKIRPQKMYSDTVLTKIFKAFEYKLADLLYKYGSLNSRIQVLENKIAKHEFIISNPCPIKIGDKIGSTIVNSCNVAEYKSYNDNICFRWEVEGYDEDKNEVVIVRVAQK